MKTIQEDLLSIQQGEEEFLACRKEDTGVKTDLAPWKSGLIPDLSFPPVD